MRAVCTYFVLLLITVASATGQNVIFSHNGGFYADAFDLSLYGPGDYTIRYTLNGSIPTAASKAYTAPISLTEQAYSPSNIYRLQNAPDDRWYLPEEVEHIIVVRAALFDSQGVRRSPVATQDYLVSSLLGRDMSLPVVSLCVDSTDLFDYDSGIFVPGRHYDPNDPNSYRTGNYYMRGREWERRAHFTFCEGGKRRLSQDCGVRIHGISQRNKSQKALTLYAREDYGEKKFSYPFFKNRTAKKYKRLVLRTLQATQPYSSDGVRDWLCQQLAEPLRCDNLASRPVVMFLNGEYWGIYFLEEKPDQHYIENLHDIDDDSVSVVNFWSATESGDPDRWNNFYDRLTELDITNPVDSAWLAASVDIDAFIDYMLLELFITNRDWPANNARCWSASGQPWRWIFFDGDYSMDDRTFDRYANLVCEDPEVSYPTSPRATLLIRLLLANETWKQRSAERLQQLVNSHFSDRRCRTLVDEIRAALDPELKYQMDRFNYPATRQVWLDDLSFVDNYLLRNNRYIVNEYQNFLAIDSSENHTDFSKMTIFPNPSIGEALLWVYSDSERDSELGIYDLRGGGIYYETLRIIAGPNLFRLPHMASGVYLVALHGFKDGARWIVQQ